MAAPTYTAHALVLKKTKLSESDLIITLLLEDGSQKQVVAKGARKPTSSFSSRLELFAEVDLLCVGGRSLDIVKEARLLNGYEPIRNRVELTYAASPLLELLVKVSQPGLSNGKLFASTKVALHALSSSEACSAPGICAAQILKILAFEGLCPSLRECVGCGDSVFFGTDARGIRVCRFSMGEGGVVCPSCASTSETIAVAESVLSWADYYLRSPFSDIASHTADLSASFEVLRLCQGLVHAQLGYRLKSLDMLFTCGLF